jgi:hypothetical protein
MYCVTLYRPTKTFNVREILSAASCELPSEEDGWEYVEEDCCGRLDSVQECLAFAKSEGWVNFSIKFER